MLLIHSAMLYVTPFFETSEKVQQLLTLHKKLPVPGILAFLYNC